MRRRSAPAPSFLTSDNLVRGFKVHASVVDPLATPLVAQSIDIETAAYSGAISLANASGFTYTRDFLRCEPTTTSSRSTTSPPAPTARMPAAMRSPATSSGTSPIPTLLTRRQRRRSAISSRRPTAASVSAARAAPIAAWGVSYAPLGRSGQPDRLERRRDRAAAGAGAARRRSLTASPATTLHHHGCRRHAAGHGGRQHHGGSATLVYQVDRGNGIVTVSPVDITTSSGLRGFTNGLAVGTPVKIYGIAQSDGTLKAYVITYFTGTAPMS